MSEDQALRLVSRPEDFFRELVTSALSRQRVHLSAQETELYLVNLLNQFMVTANLYAQDSDGNLRDEPLAFMVKEAVEEPQPENQSLLFRRVGDVSLYLAGYFRDSLARKAVGLSYYVDLGGAAYDRVASRQAESHLQNMYGELSTKFGRLVDVLAEIGDRTTPRSERDLISVYENWLRTGDARLHRLLQDAGIQPKKNKR